MSTQGIQFSDGTNNLIPIASESGNNSNGEYVKFADGTMMCWGTINIGAVSSKSIADGTATFPIAFISSPFVTAEINEPFTPIVEAGIVIR